MASKKYGESKERINAEDRRLNAIRRKHGLNKKHVKMICHMPYAYVRDFLNRRHTDEAKEYAIEAMRQGERIVFRVPYLGVFRTSWHRLVYAYLKEIHGQDSQEDFYQWRVRTFGSIPCHEFARKVVELYDQMKDEA
jgi:hypothetical protein